MTLVRENRAHRNKFELFNNKAVCRCLQQKYEISSFNSSLELYAGTEMGAGVTHLLDKIVTSNKTEGRKITVVYGNITTQDATEIKNIKKQIDTFTNYDVSYEYDELGFIKKATIEKM